MNLAKSVKNLSVSCVFAISFAICCRFNGKSLEIQGKLSIFAADDKDDDGSRQPSGLRSAYRRFDSYRLYHLFVCFISLVSY